MDDHTLEKLEFDAVRRAVAREAACGLGKGLAGRIEPSRRAAQVGHWNEQLRQMADWMTGNGDPPFGGIRDLRDLVRRAVPPAKLEPEEFAELRSTLRGAGLLRSYMSGTGEAIPALKGLADRCGDFAAIVERIDRVVDSRGRIRDDASERLLRIREEIDRIRQQIRETLDRLIRQPSVTKYLQYANVTFHADRMVLPVKADQQGRIPGIVHRSSDSGQTIFVEPAEVVELNNSRINLVQHESEEIGRILWELTHLVHLNQKEILRTLDAIAVIDLLAAKVRLMRRYEMCIPELADAPRLKLLRARNPILLMQEGEGGAAGPDATPREGGRRVVPIDVRLGDDFDVLLITGPNTGGKTATLKTTGLICLMAQAGLPIPAEHGSQLPIFDGIWIDVGDEQSLQQSLSTFSAHMTRILDMLQRARANTLTLLDELGAGTDPDEGAAIGRAIVDHLLARGGLAMITTHLGALKAVGYEAKRVDNASVQFDPKTFEPTYELQIGEPGVSNAIAIAARLGMPRAIVAAARKHLAGQHRALSRAIGKTLASRRRSERARQDAEKARQDAARATLAAMDRATALERQQREYATWVERVMRLQPGDEVFVKKFDRNGRVRRIRFEKQTASVDLGTMEADVPLSDLVFDSAAGDGD